MRRLITFLRPTFGRWLRNTNTPTLEQEMSVVQAEIKKLASFIASEFNTAKTDIETVSANPVTATIMPVAETVIKTVLTTNGVPVEQAEAAAVQVFAALKAVLQLMSVMSSLPTPVSPSATAE